MGGGILAGGPLTVRQSAIVSNRAIGGKGGTGNSPNANGADGGAGGDGEGGGVAAVNAQTLIIDSTIAQNQATGGTGGTGQSGVSGNAAASGGAGGDGGNAAGGGIFFFSISLYNSTIAANQITPGAGTGRSPRRFGRDGDAGGGGIPGTAGGGGISQIPQAVGDGTFLTSISTLIASNTIVGIGAHFDVEATFTDVTSTFVANDNGATGIVNGVNGNIVGFKPLMGPLQGNGGPTPTMALLAGSRAIDAGSNPLNLKSDQRGFVSRSVGGGVNIGAFEVGAQAPPTEPGGSKTPPDPGGSKTPIHVTTKVVKKKGHRQILVYDAATNALKFVIQPFGHSHPAKFQVTTSDVQGDGIDDVLASYRRGRKLITWSYSGQDGSLLSVAKAPASKR